MRITNIWCITISGWDINQRPDNAQLFMITSATALLHSGCGVFAAVTHALKDCFSIIPPIEIKGKAGCEHKQVFAVINTNCIE